ncbi:MAG: hypothetical protein GY749_37925, partial [Desulfobacteraceae bacterium]|nr:hypothetical protein [Desulfobacteraceae bacterium]
MKLGDLKIGTLKPGHLVLNHEIHEKNTKHTKNICRSEMTASKKLNNYPDYNGFRGGFNMLKLLSHQLKTIAVFTGVRQ